MATEDLVVRVGIGRCVGRMHLAVAVIIQCDHHLVLLLFCGGGGRDRLGHVLRRRCRGFWLGDQRRAPCAWCFVVLIRWVSDFQPVLRTAVAGGAMSTARSGCQCERLQLLE